MAGLRRRSVLAGLLAAPFVASGTRADTPGREIARHRLRRFAQGYNLPGVTDVPHDEARMPDGELIAHLVRVGLSSIRLPVEPALLLSDSGQLGHVIGTVAQLVGAGATVTIDLHPSPTTDDLLRRDEAAGRDLVEAAWTLLAPRLASLPADRVMLELLNEPAFTSDSWQALRQRLVVRLRAATTDHTLVWGAAQNQTIEETLADPGPDDGNAIAAVHYYYPMAFTHQGQSWGDTPLAAIRGLPFPFAAADPEVKALRDELVRAGATDGIALLDAETRSPWNAERMASQFDDLARWAIRTGWPVTVNEFGVFNDHAPAASRMRWLAAARTAAQARGFGWMHWELDGGFGFTSSRIDIDGIDIDALSALTVRP